MVRGDVYCVGMSAGGITEEVRHCVMFRCFVVGVVL